MIYTFRAKDIYEVNAYKQKLGMEVDFCFDNMKSNIKILKVYNYDITIEILDKQISNQIQKAFNENKVISIGYKIE